MKISLNAFRMKKYIQSVISIKFIEMLHKTFSNKKKIKINLIDEKQMRYAIIKFEVRLKLN